MGKNFQGRARSAYLIDGQPPTPPVGGWVEPNFDSAPFKFLLEQYKNHGLSTKQAPSWLWDHYPELRCVDPKRFRRFKQSCVNVYKTGNANGNTYGARTKSRKPAPTPGEMDAGCFICDPHLMSHRCRVTFPPQTHHHPAPVRRACFFTRTT